jgi:hypothetical protein
MVHAVVAWGEQLFSVGLFLVVWILLAALAKVAWAVIGRLEHPAEGDPDLPHGL